MNYDPFQQSQQLDHARRMQRRATYLAIAAFALALGVMIGASLLGRTSPVVVATNGEVSFEMSSAFVEIARRVEPSVVNISTVIQPAVRSTLREYYQEERPRLDQQFGGRARAQRGNGSGVVVDSSGYILTNHHVIAEADRIIIKFFDGNELPGRVIGSDQETDLAVIKVEANYPLPAARIGDSERARVGDWVMAIGSPFNLSQTVTAGIISAKDRESAAMNRRLARGYQYFLQTDAAINPGNSGGPLINLSGEVIGINTAIATTTGDYNGVGFALPSHEAILIYQQLIKHGKITRGFMGMITDPVTPQLAKVYGLPSARGAIISNINETITLNGQTVPSPAAHAGLRLNDVILEYRNERIRDDKDLLRRIGQTPVNTVAPLKINRDGREMMINVTVGKRPGIDLSPAEELPLQAKAQRPTGIGIEFSRLTSQLGISKTVSDIDGVYVASVVSGSLADDAGLRAGDVVESINRTSVFTKEDCQRILNPLATGAPVVLLVYRTGLEPNPRLFVSFNKP